MNKKILIPTLALSLFLPVQAFANEVDGEQATTETEQVQTKVEGVSSEDTQTVSTEEADNLVEAGLTPDDFFYSVDKIAESIEIQLAEDGVEEATVLEEIAEERVAEVVEMIEEGNTELVAPALEEYQETLDELNSQLDTAIENGEDVTELIEAIDENAETESELVEEAIDTLPESEQETISEAIEETETQLEETTETVELVEETEEPESNSLKQEVATSILVAKIGEEALKQSQENQLNERQILAIQSLADKSGKSFDEVLKVFLENDKGIGSTAKALDLKPNEVMKSVNHDFKETKKEIQKQFKATKKGSQAVQDEAVDQETVGDSEKASIQEAVETPVQTSGQKKEEAKVKPSKQPEVKQPSVTHEEKSKGKSEEKKQEHQPNVTKKAEEKAVGKPQTQEVKPQKKEEPKAVESKVTAPAQVTVPKVEKVETPKVETPKPQSTPQPSKETEHGNNGNGNGKGNGNANGNSNSNGNGNGHNK